ncbi:MAG: hypothetical protein ACD_15C00217G0015 [uncultured bacterium]|nr:MAG: hypothetical protein ACD_15C00217G0015 [uncultured bacterium]HCU71192.1 hypothetical protein [Candidatus Moranbacteria bacterium]
MKKNLLLLAIFSLLSFAGASSAQAIMTEEERTAKKSEIKAAREEKREEMIQKKEEKVEKRCAKVQEKIQSRIENFGDGKEKHMAVYKNMVDRISKFIERLSAEGYDTSKVKADLEVLKGKIEKFSTDKDARLARLDETKNYACGKSDGEFKAKLAEARTALKLVHADAADIRKYMLNTVRPDIQALKKQKIETKKTTEGSKAEEPELE